MITDFYRPYLGGVETVVRNLALELAGRGHDVSVATIRAGSLPAEEWDGPVRVHRVRCTASRFRGLFDQTRPWALPTPDPGATSALRRIVARERPDVVHGHDWLARSFLPLKRSSGAAFVLTLHYYTLPCAKKSLVYRGRICDGPGLAKCLGCASRHYGRWKGPPVVLGNFAFAAAERKAVDCFLPVSGAAATGNRLLGSGLPYEIVPNFYTAPASVPPEQQHFLAAFPKEEFLLFVGDLISRKGIDVLLDAYSSLTDPPPLLLIGKAWPGSPRRFPRNCTVLSNLPAEAVGEAYRRCKFLVVPSRWAEPFGMVVIEALAAGRPVVASGIGGITDLVEDGVNGLLVEPGDVPSLASAMQALLADAELQARLARGATASADSFRAESIVPRIEAVYRHVGSSPDGRPARDRGDGADVSRS